LRNLGLYGERDPRELYVVAHKLGVLPQGYKADTRGDASPRINSIFVGRAVLIMQLLRNTYISPYCLVFF